MLVLTQHIELGVVAASYLECPFYVVALDCSLSAMGTHVSTCTIEALHVWEFFQYGGGKEFSYF